MANESGDLQLKITLDDGSIVQGFLNVEKKAKQSSEKIENDFSGGISKISDSVKGLAVAFAAAFTAGKFIGFLKDSAAAAAEAEKANTALAASLALIGKYSEQNVKQFDDFASQLQKTTGIEDDFIKQNAALLVSVGQLSGEGLERGTKAALDLATALQVSADTGFSLIAKAASGSTAALSKYGIKIDETIPKGERFNKVLELIEQRFGGLSERNLSTFQGALTNLGNGFGEIQEAVGGFITQSPALRTVINEVAKVFFNFAETLSGIRENSGDVFKSLIENTIEFALVVNELLIKPLELGFNFLWLGIKTVLTGVNGLIALIAQIPALVGQYLITPLTKAFGFIAEKVVGFFDAEAGAKLQSSLTSFGAQITEGAQLVADSTSAVFTDSWNDLAETADNTWTSRIGGSIQGFLVNLKTQVGEAKKLGDEFKNNQTEMTETTVSKWQGLAENLRNIVGQGISNTLQKMGQNLQKGVGMFDDFGAGIVGIIGDLLITVGNALILQGLAIETFIAAINSLTFGSGLLAAAAGVGLVIFGSALKASVGAGKDGASSTAATGGGVAATPSPATELTQQDQLQQVDDSPKIQVVIQGDVLDSDESGSRIIDLINKSFDKKGTVLNQGVMS